MSKLYGIMNSDLSSERTCRGNSEMTFLAHYGFKEDSRECVRVEIFSTDSRPKILINVFGNIVFDNRRDNA